MVLIHAHPFVKILINANAIIVRETNVISSLYSDNMTFRWKKVKNLVYLLIPLRLIIINFNI